MKTTARIARAWWLGHWRFYQRYHRYRIEGFERLAEGPAALIVGYHGRSIARDMCMLATRVHDRLGYFPHAIFHRGFTELPLLGAVVEGVDGVAGEPSIRAALDRGEHLLVTPGGTREGCRSRRHRYRVDWGGRTGYLRLALRFGLDIIPVAARGTDDTYVGLNDGYRLSKRLGVPAGLPLWLGLGPLGPWPLSPPFPVRIRQRVGARIPLPAIEPDDDEAVSHLHQRVVGAVQELLDAVGVDGPQ